MIAPVVFVILVAFLLFAGLAIGMHIERQHAEQLDSLRSDQVKWLVSERNEWRETAWKRERDLDVLRMRYRELSLKKATEEVSAPDTGEQFEDPPTLGQADKKAMDRRRAQREEVIRRSPLSVRDRDVPPVPQLRERDSDEE